MGVRKHWRRFRGERIQSRIRFLIYFGLCLLASILMLAVFHFFEIELPSRDILGSVILGGLLAVVLHYFFRLIDNFLTSPFLDEIPEGFYHAAEEELHDIGYYKISAKVEIAKKDKIIDGTEGEYLEVTFSSVIVGAEKSHIDKKSYHFGPSVTGNQIVPSEIHYKIGKIEWKSKSKRTINQEYEHEYEDGIIPIEKGEHKSEIVKAYYYLEKDESRYGDDHIWQSPVSGGFSVQFKLPEYDCNALIKRGPKLKQIEDRRADDEGEHFFYPKSLFSNQGFHWSITKKET